MAKTLLSTHELCLERGGRCLVDKLTLEVAGGELMLVEGANGAGKTTLLRSLAGLSSIGQSGDIQRHSEKLLFLGHKAGVKQLLTARENLAWFCDSHLVPHTGIDAALEQVGLYGYEDVLCQHMSAGQQRRVNLARRYLSRADLWLLDEPFTAIDREGVKALTQTLVERVQGGAAVIMTSHQDLPLQYPLRRLQLGASP
jgi:heme exporter protein A